MRQMNHPQELQKHITVEEISARQSSQNSPKFYSKN